MCCLLDLLTELNDLTFAMRHWYNFFHTDTNACFWVNMTMVVTELTHNVIQYLWEIAGWYQGHPQRRYKVSPRTVYVILIISCLPDLMSLQISGIVSFQTAIQSDEGNLKWEPSGLQPTCFLPPFPLSSLVGLDFRWESAVCKWGCEWTDINKQTRTGSQ